MELNGLVCIGECMVELARTTNRQFQLSYGGDTFNTSVYARRVGLANVSYMTAIGDDPYSDGIIDLAREEGLDVDSIARVPGRTPGLYLIETDGGERTFTYWRDRAPARRMFDAIDRTAALKALCRARYIYISGITLSILEIDQRDILASLIAEARMAGSLLVMDANYRPAGWPLGIDDARDVMGRFWRLTDIAMPSRDDEIALWADADNDAICDRLHGFGCPVIVLKDGPDGALLSRVGAPSSLTRSSEQIPCPAVASPVDTTAAGDSFNGAFLAAIHDGAAEADGIKHAHEVAREVVTHPGAIVPRAATAKFAQTERSV